MRIEPQTYIMTDTDTNFLVDRGWEIENNSNLSVNDFVNSFFPNFNICKFLDEVDQVLANCSSKIIKKLKFEETFPKIWVYYYAENEDLAFIREFFYEEGIIQVSHSLFVIPGVAQNKGIAKLVFQNSLQQYININLAKIHVYAALDTGGYVWAKHHFTANSHEEMVKILQKAKVQLADNQYKYVLRIFENYYNSNPRGNAFPIVKWAEMPFMKDILLGSNWHGTMDLRNTQQFSNFIKYVFR